MAETNNASNEKQDAKATSAERRASGAADALDAKLSEPLAPLESALDGVFGTKAAYQLPGDIKDTLVKIAPWLALIGGVLGIMSAYNLWRAAYYVNQWADAVNDAFGGLTPVRTTNLSLTFWLAIGATVLFAVLALLAFPGLKAQKKVGWNLMFYSLLASIAYGVISFFMSGGFAGGSLIGGIVGLYILFQVRERYKA